MIIFITFCVNVTMILFIQLHMIIKWFICDTSNAIKES